MDETSVRQGMSPTAKAAVHRHTEAAVFFRTCLHQDQIRTHIRDPETGEILDLDPVSYTHLDVYKRQVYRSANNRFDSAASHP